MERLLQEWNCYRYTIYEEDSRILTWIEGIFEDVKIVRVLFQKIDIRGEGRDCKLSFILSSFIKFRIVKVGSSLVKGPRRYERSSTWIAKIVYTVIYVG